MFEISEKEVNRIRKRYPVGIMIRLIKMDDIQAPPVGTKGIVTHVDDLGTVFVHWDNGSGLGVVLGEDIIEKI